GARDHHRDPLQPGPINREGMQQLRHSRQANTIAIFRKVKHYSNPMAQKVWRQIFRMRSPRSDSSKSRIDGLEFTSMILIASRSPPISVNRSTAATRRPRVWTAFLANVTAIAERGISISIVPPALRFI